MKYEDDGFLIEIKQELEGVESTLHQVDGLFEQAQKAHDPEKIQKYKEMRSSLIKSRDKLQSRIEKAIAEYDALHSDEHNAIATVWQAFKNDLAEFIKIHRP